MGVLTAVFIRDDYFAVLAAILTSISFTATYILVRPRRANIARRFEVASLLIITVTQVCSMAFLRAVHSPELSQDNQFWYSTVLGAAMVLLNVGFLLLTLCFVAWGFKHRNDETQNHWDMSKLQGYAHSPAPKAVSKLRRVGQEVRIVTASSWLDELPAQSGTAGGAAAGILLDPTREGATLQSPSILTRLDHHGSAAHSTEDETSGESYETPTLASDDEADTDDDAALVHGSDDAASTDDDAALVHGSDDAAGADDDAAGADDGAALVHASDDEADTGDGAALVHGSDDAASTDDGAALVHGSDDAAPSGPMPAQIRGPWGLRGHFTWR